MNITPITIAFACDEKYAQHVAVVMKSIFAHAEPNDRHEFHILTMDLTSKSKERLEEVAIEGKGTLVFHKLDSKYLKGLPESRYTFNAYLRLFLPKIIDDLDKILYVDADIIVLDSLAELWNIPLKACPIAAAVDSIEYFRESSADYLRSLSLPAGHKYFNSGVLLLNLRVLREIGFTEKICAWMVDNLNLVTHPDQNGLNVLLGGQVTYLHPRWNLQVPLINPVRFGWGCTQQQAEAVANPAIVHYVTGRKPWFRQYKLPYQHLYFQYLAQTPWKEDPLPSYTFSHRLQCLGEELDYSYKWSRSEIRRLLGRHPKPVKELC